jgi:isopenicillin-N epimerase
MMRAPCRHCGKEGRVTLSRRRFLAASGASLAAASAGTTLAVAEALTAAPPSAALLQDWAAVRAQFTLAPEYVHLGLFYMTAHPRPVRESIEAYRRALDANPFLTVERSMFEADADNIPLKVCAALGGYFGADPNDIALTTNTTMGLALVYHGLPLRPGDEVLCTTHDHFVHHEAIRLATEKTGASWRRIPLFDAYDALSADEMVARLIRAIRPETRVVGVTWVHSASGLRLPIRRIADALATVNAGRAPGDRVLLVVDGVHGVGVEDPKTVATMGADFFVAGLHKWIFGPRGTGFVWAPAANWARLKPLVPTFTAKEVFDAWGDGHPPSGPARAAWFSPGGFQSFEHYWSIPAAIAFHEAIGPARVTERIHALNGAMNAGLRQMKNVVVYTPKDPALASGLVCFDVKGMPCEQVVAKLLAQKIIASSTPYKVSFARVACSIVNTPAEVEQTLAAVRALA